VVKSGPVGAREPAMARDVTGTCLEAAQPPSDVTLHQRLQQMSQIVACLGGTNKLHQASTHHSHDNTHTHTHTRLTALFLGLPWVSRYQKGTIEAQLSPRDRAMRRVSSNLANYHATVQKLLVRQVLNQVLAVAIDPCDKIVL